MKINLHKYLLEYQLAISSDIDIFFLTRMRTNSMINCPPRPQKKKKFK